jgi:hypothetical protein
MFSQFEIKGRIIDEGNFPVEFAEMVLSTKDSLAIQGVLSNKEGYFSIEANEGNYIYEIRQVGKVLSSGKIELTQNIDLGIIKVNFINEMEQVVLVSKKKVFEKKVDRLIFNVENLISTAGGNAIDVLRITPRLRVIEDRVSMVGKNNMKVMIDSKIIPIGGEDLVNFLNSISSDDIKKIEIITTPPAKYNAEGNSGLINIIYKKSKSDSWSSKITSTYSQYTYPVGSLGGSFNYNKGRLSIGNNLFFTNGSRLITDANTTFYSDQTWESVAPRRVFYKPILSGRFNIDYKFNKKIDVGLQYLGNYKQIEIEQKSRTEITKIEDSNTIHELILSRASSKSISPSHSINLNSTFKLDSLGKKIILNADYFSYENDINRKNTSHFFVSNGSEDIDKFNANNNTGIQSIENYSGKIDVELPLKFAKLEFGGRLSYTKTDNDNNSFDLSSGAPIFVTDRANLFQFKENTQALYLSTNKTISDKWEAQLGLRLENTSTEGFSKTNQQRNKNSYTKLFPTANIIFIPNDINSYSLSINSRIQRPSFEFLNPFRIEENQFSFVEGNPNLNPSFSYNIEFTYDYKNKWITTFYFSRTIDDFSQVALSDEESNIQQTIPLNFSNFNSYGISESFSFSPFKWWENNSSLDLYYSTYTSTISTIDLNEWEASAYFSTSQSWTINKKKTIFINSNFLIQLPTYGNLYSVKQYNGLDLSLKFLAFNNKMNVTLIGSDIFGSLRPQVKEIANNIKIEYNNYRDFRKLRFSVQYSFGNSKLRTKKGKFGNEEELKRVSN